MVGDTHGASHWLRNRVVPHAVESECTHLVQLGDFGFVWEDDPIVAQRELTRLDLILARHDLTLHFLPGFNENHAMLGRLSESAPRSPIEQHYQLKPGILYTGRVSVWSWQGLRVAAVGGAVSVAKEHHMDKRPEGLLRREEVAVAQQLGPVDLLFTHDAPMEMPDHALRPHVPVIPSREVMNRIGKQLQPKVWIHGRYHRLLRYRFPHPGGSSVVMGLGRDGGPLNATTAILDLDRFRAVLDGQS